MADSKPTAKTTASKTAAASPAKTAATPDPTATDKPGTAVTTTGSATPATAGAGAGALTSDHGRTTIADTVVSKIAGIATREVGGVHDLGGTTARTVGALRDRIPGGGTNLSQGVSVEVGERQAAVDLDLVAEYGVPLAELASAVRTNVISAIEQMTGLEVTEVNVTIHDVHLEDDDADRGDPRVE